VKNQYRVMIMLIWTVYICLSII